MLERLSVIASPYSFALCLALDDRAHEAPRFVELTLRPGTSPASLLQCRETGMR